MCSDKTEEPIEIDDEDDEVDEDMRIHSGERAAGAKIENTVLETVCTGGHYPSLLVPANINLVEIVIPLTRCDSEQQVISVNDNDNDAEATANKRENTPLNWKEIT